jgi:hypothetical protein
VDKKSGSGEKENFQILESDCSLFFNNVINKNEIVKTIKKY